MSIDLDAIEARAAAVPYDVIPHGPTPTGALLLCLTDANDTGVGRLWGPHEVVIAALLAHARQDIPALCAEVRRLAAETARCHAEYLAIGAKYDAEDQRVSAEIVALMAEVETLRAALAPTIPTRLTLPDGSTAEIVDVRVSRTLRTGGSWHESMSVASWRGLRQEEGREVLRDRGGGTE